ncbi:ML4, partial [Symbiodinium sp. KB8]
MSSELQGQDKEFLSDGATAIMIKRLPSKLTVDDLLSILDANWSGCYDFVYVPHDKTKERNVALAFVNFTVHAVAQTAYAYFQGRLKQMDGRLGSHIRVSQADVQGLSLNLAYFIARSGLMDLDNPYAPRVFEDGRRVHLLEAAMKHVTMKLLEQASVRMCSGERGRLVQTARTRKPHDRIGDARSETCGTLQSHEHPSGTCTWHAETRDAHSSSSGSLRSGEDCHAAVSGPWRLVQGKQQDFGYGSMQENFFQERADGSIHFFL